MPIPRSITDQSSMGPRNSDCAELAVTARQLTKTVDGRRILDRLDLEIAPGESVAVLGANGAGKTTLLRCLAATWRPSSGEVRWFGRSAWGNAAARRLVGVLAHDSFLYPELTARENLLFAARMSNVRYPADRAQELLTLGGLAHAARQPTGRLSKGTRQRLSILRALVHQPRILLLDEPFSALDAEGDAWLVSLLGELRDSGRAICFSTHRQELGGGLATRMLRLRAGRLVPEAAGDLGPGDRRDNGTGSEQADGRPPRTWHGLRSARSVPVPLSATQGDNRHHERLSDFQETEGGNHIPSDGPQPRKQAA